MPWQIIYEHLKNKGFDVYSPSQHQGDCISPYIVIKAGAVSELNGYSSVQAYYELLCYVPKDNYSTLEDYVNSVKEAMAELYPAIVYTRFDTEPFYDDTINGHMVSIQYRNNRKFSYRR